MKLALGTAQFGMGYGLSNTVGKVPQFEAQKMLNFALDNSIDLLDTAISYGSSEECLGHAGVADFKVITKLPPVPENCANIYDWVEQQIAASRARIGVDTFYGLLLHKAGDLIGAKASELYTALDAHRGSGDIQKIGISIYSPQELDLINEKFSIDIVQAPFNLIDRRLHTSGWLHRLKDRGIEVHVRSIFLQGLLLMHLSDIPPKFNRWPDLWMRWNQWKLENAVAPINVCISFARQFEEIDRMIVGATSVRELQEITNAFSNNFVGPFPNLESFDDMLLNPSNWNSL
jgi:aryl-alcohol dehydrogenase-like predicted oxidoreductase